MDRDLSSELLAVLDHSRFLSISSQGALWQITYDDSPTAEMGAISSENLANLLTAWRDLRERWVRMSVATDAEYQRGYKAGYDRAAAEVRDCLVECDSELSAQGHGRPASSRDELLKLSGRCRDLSNSKSPVPKQ